MVNIWELSISFLDFELIERTFQKKFNTFKNKEVRPLSK